MKWTLLVALLAVGCGSGDSEVTSADSAPTDTGTRLDSSAADTTTSDSQAGETSASDATDSSADASTDACGYVDVDDVVVMCDGKYVMLGYFNVVPGSSSCPPYWAFPGKSGHPTKEDAIAAAGCSAMCIYKFSTSVTRLYCGKKTGYEVLRATDCADLYRFAEGYYASVEAHDAANPCP
jgi:hypothetical protein